MRKVFKHHFVDYIDTYTESINGKRYYVLPDGRKFPSVTTVIGERLDKTGLQKWRDQVGDQVADQIKIQAANRGTDVHNIAEQYCLNNIKYTEGSMPFAINSFNKIKQILDENVNHILGLEIPLYSEQLNAAGRCDLIAGYNNIPSIIDFKTSKKNKKEEWIEGYFIQVTAYAMMFESMYGYKINKGVIIIAVDNSSTAQVFEFDIDSWKDRTTELFCS